MVIFKYTRNHFLHENSSPLKPLTARKTKAPMNPEDFETPPPFQTQPGGGLKL